MVTLEETMAAIKMVLDAAGDADEEIPTKDICESIDWFELERLEKAYDVQTKGEEE